MIYKGVDLQKKTEVFQVEEIRDWRTLGLTKRVKRTKVFTGYINHYYFDNWTGDILEVVDQKHRDRQQNRYQEIEKVGFIQADGPLEANPGVKKEFMET